MKAKEQGSQPASTSTDESACVQEQKHLALETAAKRTKPEQQAKQFLSIEQFS